MYSVSPFTVKMNLTSRTSRGMENSTFTFRIGDQTIFIANKINMAGGVTEFQLECTSSGKYQRNLRIILVIGCLPVHSHVFARKVSFNQLIESMRSMSDY